MPPIRAVLPLPLIGLFVALVACKSAPSDPAATGAAASAGTTTTTTAAATGGGGSCSVPDPKNRIGSCIDFVGSDFKVADGPKNCGPAGHYSKDPCPAADRIGSCSMNPGTPKATIVRSYPLMKMVAETSCPGVWTPN